MNNTIRFFGIFALLTLVGAGCFSSQNVVVDIDDDKDAEEVEETQETETTVELVVGSYTIDSQHSEVAWVGRKPGTAHNGTIDITEGSLVTGEDVSGEVIIDMNSIVDLDLDNEVMNKSLVDHLKSDDFFDTEAYPTATFTFTDLQWGEGDENLQVTGVLTIKGVSNDVTFPAQVLPDNEAYRLRAQFELDRTKWGVSYGSESLLGSAIDVIIDDMMTIGLDIALVSAE